MANVLMRDAGKVANAKDNAFTTLVSIPVGRAMVKKANAAAKECPYYRSVDITEYENAVVIRGLDSDGIPTKMSHLTKGLTNRRWLYYNGWRWNKDFKVWESYQETPDKVVAMANVVQLKLREWIGLYKSNNDSAYIQRRLQDITHVSLGELVTD